MPECRWCTDSIGACVCKTRCTADTCRVPGTGDTRCPGLGRDGHRRPTRGEPDWCSPCREHIVKAVLRLPVACRALSPGQLVHHPGETGATRRATIVGSPSGSPAYDELDAVLRWAAETEDRLRDRLGHSRITGARRLTDSCRYLAGWSTAWLCGPDAHDDGREAVALYRRVVRGTGWDELVHRLDGVRCPVCQCQALFREDGSSEVRCGVCFGTWPEELYRHLTRVLADEAREGMGS